jgi:hypothetical protein
VGAEGKEAKPAGAQPAGAKPADARAAEPSDGEVEIIEMEADEAQPEPGTAAPLPMAEEVEETTEVVSLMEEEARMAGGLKPTIVGLRTVLAATGAILIAMVLVPVAVTPKVLFTWDLLGRGPMWSAIYPLYLGASGAVFILCALMAVPHLFRVGITATAATIPLVMLGSGSGPCGTVAAFMNVGWSFWPFLAGCLLSAVGLSLLLHAPRWTAGRGLLAGGAVCMITAMCVPQHGTVPVATALRALAGGHALWPASLVQLLLLVAVVLSVVVFLVRAPEEGFLRGSVRGIGALVAVGLGLTVLAVQMGLIISGHMKAGQSLGTVSYGVALGAYGVAAVAAWAHLVFWMAGGEIFERRSAN